MDLTWSLVLVEVVCIVSEEPAGPCVIVMGSEDVVGPTGFTVVTTVEGDEVQGGAGVVVVGPAGGVATMVCVTVRGPRDDVETGA